MMPTSRTTWGLVAVVLGSGACNPDLPEGWEGAARLALTQSPCEGSAYDGSTPETVSVTPHTGGLSIRYTGAHFRCEQAVEGFVRSDGFEVALLVQPEDMAPFGVAGCDCLYDIEAAMEVAPGEYSVSVYRRWDSINKPNPPVLVGSSQAVGPST
jgi:hypothetical protein